MRAHLLVEPGLLLELLHGVDLAVEELGDADLRRDALRHARRTGDGADVALLPATRSPAALMPPIDEASRCAMCMPAGSPVPTYNPSALPISIMAALHRVTTSTAGVSNIGTPPTPMPTLG